MTPLAGYVKVSAFSVSSVMVNGWVWLSLVKAILLKFVLSVKAHVPLAGNGAGKLSAPVTEYVLLVALKEMVTVPAGATGPSPLSTVATVNGPLVSSLVFFCSVVSGASSSLQENKVRPIKKTSVNK